MSLLPHLSLKNIILPALLALLASCASTPESAKISAPAGPHAFDRIAQGMTAAEVRGLAGEPVAITPFPSGGPHCFVWMYERKVSESVVQVPIGTQELPRMNPITGQMGTVHESIMGNEHTVVSETIELLMLDDRLIQLKRKPNIERTIVN